MKKSPTFNPDVTIPLLLPEPDAPCVNSDFLKNESDGITKSNTNPVTATPANEVVPIPVMIPWSPEYDLTVFFSSRTGSAPIRTTGGVASLYSVPAVETVILVTTPFVIDAVASARAVVPSPTGF